MYEGTVSNPIYSLPSMTLLIFWVNRRVTSGALELSILGVLRPKDAFRIECDIERECEHEARINRDKYRSGFLLHFIKQNVMFRTRIVEYEITNMREPIYSYRNILNQ